MQMAKHSKVLIVGGGGREHALAWRLSRDSTRPEIFCAPGNAGTSGCGANVAIASDDHAGLLYWAERQRPDLTVVGPEAPLCEGITDEFQSRGLRVFGPSKAAARLEGSKAFAKEIMQAAGVPTAEARRFDRADEACRYIRERGAPMVVKADGLAAGKGVTVCRSVEQAEAAVLESLEQRAFGEAGASVLVEECLDGQEASILGLVDGHRVVLLASAQDHKRALDGDEGPNTGGMGAYSPAPVVRPDLIPTIRKTVFNRTLNELSRRGIEFKGVLYAGLMLTEQGPKVLEFNCRFGDPETQAILPRWTGDMLPALQACVDGTLREEMVNWSSEHCVCVVMASGGYPGPYRNGEVIHGVAEAERLPGVQVFHAGTERDEKGRIVTSGGRVLGVTALGSTLANAVKSVYQAVSAVRFNGAQFRGDIAARAL